MGIEISERELEDYLVENLELILPGLELIDRQFEVPAGIIDILAHRQGRLVLVELKTRHAHLADIGQLLLYAGSFDAYLAKRITTPSPVKGVWWSDFVDSWDEFKERINYAPILFLLAPRISLRFLTISRAAGIVALEYDLAHDGAVLVDVTSHRSWEDIGEKFGMGGDSWCWQQVEEILWRRLKDSSIAPVEGNNR